MLSRKINGWRNNRATFQRRKTWGADFNSRSGMMFSKKKTEKIGKKGGKRKEKRFIRDTHSLIQSVAASRRCSRSLLICKARKKVSSKWRHNLSLKRAPKSSLPSLATQLRSPASFRFFFFFFFGGISTFFLPLVTLFLGAFGFRRSIYVFL